MSTQMVSTGEMFSMIEHQLKMTEQQGTALRMLFQGMQQMQEDVTMKYEETQIMVQEVRDSITLIDREQFELQEVVRKKSYELAKRIHKDGGDKFKELVGKYRRLMWSKLKERFEVARYSHIRRIEFDDALDFAKNFCPEDYI